MACSDETYLLISANEDLLRQIAEDMKHPVQPQPRAYTHTDRRTHRRIYARTHTDTVAS